MRIIELISAEKVPREIPDVRRPRAQKIYTVAEFGVIVLYSRIVLATVLVGDHAPSSRYLHWLLEALTDIIDYLRPSPSFSVTSAWCDSRNIYCTADLEHDQYTVRSSLQRFQKLSQRWSHRVYSSSSFNSQSKAQCKIHRAVKCRTTRQMNLH